MQVLLRRVLLVELGSGSRAKTEILLDHLAAPAACVPVDISRGLLLATAERLAGRHPEMLVQPVCGDYTRPCELPPSTGHARTIVYLPGSTIGNFAPLAARAFLGRIAALCGPDGARLIGVDLRKDRAILEAAYDDREGVTAELNLNLLARINRELGGGFELGRFSHRATWHEGEGQIAMYLVSEIAQTVRACGQESSFAAGEAIHTEDSYKFGLDEFVELAASAGFEVARVWTDEAELFSVQYLTVE